FVLSPPRPPRSTPFPTRRSSDLSEKRHLPPHGGDATRLRSARHRRDFDGRRATDAFGVACLAEPSSIAARRRCRSAAFGGPGARDRKSTRLNSSHVSISYAVFCL